MSMKGTYFLKQDMKRAFTGKTMWFSVILLTGILIHGTVTYTNMNPGASSTYVYIINAMALSGFGPFAAVFPALGYSVRFCEEYSSGYFQMIMARISWKKFGIVRIISVGLSGGAIIGIPFLCICIMGYVLGVHGVPQDGFMEGTQMVYYIGRYGDLFVLSFKVLLGFLFGILFALVSFAFAVWSCNRYVTVIAPFILYETMWFVLYEYPLINPIYLFRGDDLGSYPLSAFMELIYIVIVIIISWIGLKKKVEYE
ncbi:MAG: hypothetical protein ACI4A3_09165 [Lachnospiraceae bacterium]